MLRSASIFLVAILLPSLVLAYLGVRSARDQQFLLEHQQAVIYQNVSDRLAETIQAEIKALPAEFIAATDSLLNDLSAKPVDSTQFNSLLPKAWPLAQIGFVVDRKGHLQSPSRAGSSADKVFRAENDRFLGDLENAEVYASPSPQTTTKFRAVTPDEFVTGKTLPAAAAGERLFTPPPSSERVQNGARTQAPFATAQKKQKAPDQIPSLHRPLNETAPQDASTREAEEQPPTVPAPETASASLSKTEIRSRNTSQVRQVVPQNTLNATTPPLSNTQPKESDFRRLIGQNQSGIIARFLDDQLRLLFWYRPSKPDDSIYGAQVNLPILIKRLRPLLQSAELTAREASLRSPALTPPYCLALLDDKGRPVALSLSGFKADWKHPFVATEIGDVLPHWEAALYLTDPLQLSKAAGTLQLTIGLIILLLLVAIVAGGSLIAADIRRQVLLARQKTDFVSNVSHELKTPLTSIRMFADLLAEGRVTEPERRQTYLKIISAESARLTRLINNVLDFARQENGAPAGEKRACNLSEIAEEVVATCRPHLEAGGHHLVGEVEAKNLPLLGDRDALAQIIVNLVSNAEKYGGNEIVVRIRRQESAAGPCGCVDVLDRGPGIPAAEVKSIFLPFQRLHDSLSHGIPGSGLGLTLARRMAREHAGDVTYSPRAGGGSCFTLTLPLTPAFSSP